MKKWSIRMITGLLLGSLTLAAGPALAESSLPDVDQQLVDQRELHQQQRIVQGVESGQITPREFNRLEAEQARIRAAEARMRADGTLTPREQARLNGMLDRSNAHIYQARHNGQAVGQPRHHGPPGYYGYSGHQRPPGYYGYSGHQGHPGYCRGVDARQWRQQQRIYQGVRSGQITPGEVSRLEQQQGRIRATESRMRADGNFTPQERTRVNSMQNRGSTQIYRARTNNRVVR